MLNGKSAYELAVDAGFEGTEDEWIASLKGEKGDTGNTYIQETPLFASSIEECTDQTKLYVLPDGYFYAYFRRIIEGSVTPNFTNQIPISTEIDSDEPFDGRGYKIGYYLTSSSPFYAAGNEVDWLTGCIPYTTDKPIYVKGATFTTDSHCRIYFFSDKNTREAPSVNGSNIENYFTLEQLDTDYYKLTPISGSGLSAATQYVRLGFTTGTPLETIITVDEPITYTTVEDAVIEEWANTGHAFVPADYEDRIVELERSTTRNTSNIYSTSEKVTNLETEVSSLTEKATNLEAVLARIEDSSTIAPDGVLTAVSALVNKTTSREDTRIIRFLISSDAHQKNDHTDITKGNLELGQAHSEILKLISVDFVANLGDTTWGSSASDNATVLEEGKTFNRFMLDSIRGETQIWTEGNHETDMLTDSQIYALIYSHNKKLIHDADHWLEGYGYVDFDKQKVRVICLNTNQSTGSDASGVSDQQLKWLAEIALNMEGRSDWSVITMGHHPISFNNVTLCKNCARVMEAFILGSNLSFTTNDGMELAIDYSNRNCQYVGHFHGHAHAYSVVRMQKWVSSGVYEELDAWEICIPNACYTRNNQYLNNGTYTERYSTETTYNKEDIDGKRTSFNLVTICLDKKIIYADNYGAGIDREVSY